MPYTVSREVEIDRGAASVELCNIPDDTLVLPSHGKPFKGIRSRVDQLVEHHRERCEVLLAACRTPRTAAELLPTLFPRALDTHQVMFAMGEAIAHLNHLWHAGRLGRSVGADGGIRFAHAGHEERDALIRQAPAEAPMRVRGRVRPRTCSLMRVRSKPPAINQRGPTAGPA